MILELLALLCSCGGESTSNDNFGSQRKRRANGFEEADSVFDRHGNEHILDDDGYCEDCDDYHDDW